MTAARRILYVAFAHSLSDTRRMVMEHAGYVVTTVDNAQAAREKLRREAFDLVIIGARVPRKVATEILDTIHNDPAKPLSISLDNRSHLETDYTLQPLAGPEELLAVLGDALIRRHGHPAPNDACYMFVDENRRYVHVTDAATELLGYDRGELIGKTIDQIAAPEMDVAGKFESYVEDGFQKGTFRLRRRDGMFVDIAYAAEVLPDGCMVSHLMPAKNVGYGGRPPAAVRKIRP